MNPGSISFQITLEKMQALDAVARVQNRSRDLVLNEALEIYLGLQSHHLGLIKNGIRDADEGRLISQSAVRELTKKWSQN